VRGGNYQLSYKSLQEAAGVLNSVKHGMAKPQPTGFNRGRSLAGSALIAGKRRPSGARFLRDDCFLIFDILGAGRARQHSSLLYMVRQTLSDGGQGRIWVSTLSRCGGFLLRKN
jgi:hypothetical protein